jgi:hypothetical protein
MVLDSVVSPHSKRNYAKALDDLFAFCVSRHANAEYDWKSFNNKVYRSLAYIKFPFLR